MRTLLALSLVLAVVGCSDRPESPATHDAPSASVSTGPDPLVLRIPRRGGVARAFSYGRPDSVVWTSSDRVPAPARVLAFDEEGGHVAFVTEQGHPGRLDLRAGNVSVSTKPKLTALASVDGSTIFGVAGDSLIRLTPVGNWSFKPPARPRAIFPQPDGSILVAADRRDSTFVWRVRPPSDQLFDTLATPAAGRELVSIPGDRVYFADSTRLVAVRSRGLEAVPPVLLDGRIGPAAATPSGDRLYVAIDSGRALALVDRYTSQTRRLELPGPSTALRMDPFGRYLLVRPARGDSAWVVAIGTDRVIGAVQTAWRSDLPAVAPDGRIALVRGDDVVYVDGETLRPHRTVAGGASDFWYFFLWNGFRPRAEGLDAPVEFQESSPDSAIWGIPIDTTTADTAAAAAPAPPTPPPAPTPTAGSGWTAQFAALLDEGKARELAAEIGRARVVTTNRAGTPVYRVVIGPFSTREEAERAGRAAGRNFWVFEGTP